VQPRHLLERPREACIELEAAAIAAAAEIALRIDAEMTELAGAARKSP
jgi:hypothetical protein